MTRTIKPTPEDVQFHEAMLKALQLDKQLQPALHGIYRHLCQVLEPGRDLELFQLYVILQSGASLSLYAPRYLLSMDMVLGDYLDIYTRWARKAQDLLQEQETKRRPAVRRKGQFRANSGTLEDF